MAVGVVGGRRRQVKRGSNRSDPDGRESEGISTRSIFFDDLGLGVGGEGDTFQGHRAILVEGLAGGAEAWQVGRVDLPAFGFVVIADSYFAHGALLTISLEQLLCFLLTQSDVLGQDLPDESRWDCGRILEGERKRGIVGRSQPTMRALLASHLIGQGFPGKHPQ